MKLSYWFFANTIVSGLFGLGFLLVPAATLAPYGYTPDAGATQLTRVLGASYLGYAALAWLARGIRDAAALRRVL